MIKTCKSCKMEYETENRKQRYCSHTCAGFINRNPEVSKFCKNCGDEFFTRLTQKIFCCKSCQKKHHSLRCKESKSRLEYQRSRFIILNRDNFTCFYCGSQSFSDGIELHIDHVIPEKNGGQSLASNLVTSCIECNLGKSAMRIFNENDVVQEIDKRNKAANISPSLIIKV